MIGVAAKYLHPEIDSLYAMPIFLQDMNPWLAGLVTTSGGVHLRQRQYRGARHCLPGGQRFLRADAQPDARAGV